MSALCQKDVGRWQPNLTSSGRGRRPHSRRILDDRASLWLYHCPIVRADNLRALWRNPDHAKSANHRMYRLPDTVGRRIRQLDDQTTPARASPDRRHKKPCLGIHGGGCHGFGAGAWAADLERQHLVPCARGRRNHAIGANPQNSTTYCADTGRTHIQLGRRCDSMPNRRLPICFPTKGQTFASTTRRHTHCSSGSKIRCLN